MFDALLRETNHEVLKWQHRCNRTRETVMMCDWDGYGNREFWFAARIKHDGCDPGTKTGFDQR